MKTGMITEVKRSYLIVMTADGEFCRARKPERDYQIGEEIEFTPVERNSLFSGGLHIPMQKQVISTLSFLLVLIAGSYAYFNHSNQVYGVVSIDINPSFGISVNKNMEVVAIDAYNDDAKQLLAVNNDWKKEPVEDVTKQLVSDSLSKGNFDSYSDILISTMATAKGTETDEFYEVVTSRLQNLEQAYPVHMTIFQTTASIYEESLKNNISPGKYALFIAANAKGFDYTVQDVKMKNVSQIKEDVGQLEEVVGSEVSDEQYQAWKDNPHYDSQGNQDSAHEQGNTQDLQKGQGQQNSGSNHDNSNVHPPGQQMKEERTNKGKQDNDARNQAEVKRAQPARENAQNEKNPRAAERSNNNANQKGANHPSNQKGNQKSVDHPSNQQGKPKGENHPSNQN
ncbi:anti-sigma factor domain-containing protein [Desertibacillus haloalkaliphilus]|uniref:anti-sigma factor domain-containing protein n=1 Tax=Desertibacillus haloalkaliphilus TaxID=1328930 RepID=UPI001C26D857|nr:anti-sigma factor domain-containing protein [Desertibacillus haloalkaliphilus]MBU8907324.1 anti-sigma factor domain-containing protein [Desertibacillus haloalkaliphilus]